MENLKKLTLNQETLRNMTNDKHLHVVESVCPPGGTSCTVTDITGSTPCP
jgi:hypothetical protein